MKTTSYIEIDANCLSQNIQTIRSIVNEKTHIAAIVKSNAYGHGLQEIVTLLKNNDTIDWYGVNSLQEALQIRMIDSNRPVLVMGNSLGQYSYGCNKGITFVISSCEELDELNALDTLCDVHIKVDTGMGRLGFKPEEVVGVLNTIHAEYQNINVTGVMSHFSNVEDVIDQKYALLQLERFEQVKKNVCDTFKNDSFTFHISASAATFLLPQAHFDMVRIGISLYGLWASKEAQLSANKVYAPLPTLYPVLQWKSSLAHIHTVKKGNCIGYGCTYEATHDMVIGVVPAGYYEGYDRRLSNNSCVLIKGTRCLVVGRICMNMLMVDVTNLEGDISAGEEVVLFGRQGKVSITIDDIANRCNTVNYEIVSRINNNLDRIIV